LYKFPYRKEESKKKSLKLDTNNEFGSYKLFFLLNIAKYGKMVSVPSGYNQLLNVILLNIRISKLMIFTKTILLGVFS